MELVGGSLSQVSIKNYDYLLGRLNKMGINYKSARNVDDIKKKILENSKVSDTTIRMYLQAILYSGENRFKTFEKKAREFITATSRKEQEIRGTNKLVNNQKNNYVGWDHILDIYEKVKDKKDDNYLNYAILSLYILFPPRRLSDYALMYISKDSKYKVNRGYTKLHETKNYYDIKKKSFVFNDYKTNKKVIKVDGKDKYMYKQQIFKVPTVLSKVLNEYIKKYKITDKLFNYNATTLGNKIKQIFRTEIKKDVSVNILRHSFISHILNNREKYNSSMLNEIADTMAHSNNMQSQYYKIE